MSEPLEGTRERGVPINVEDRLAFVIQRGS
jgi:hypothetical protein